MHVIEHVLNLAGLPLGHFQHIATQELDVKIIDKVEM